MGRRFGRGIRPPDRHQQMAIVHNLINSLFYSLSDSEGTGVTTLIIDKINWEISYDWTAQINSNFG